MPKPLPLDPASLSPDLMDRIKARIQEEGDCWNWTGSYGNKVPVIGFTREEVPHHRPRKDNRYVYVAVRRALFALLRTPGANRQASGRLMVASCGNPACVNPDHIRAITRSDMARIMGQQVNLEALAQRGASVRLILPDSISAANRRNAMWLAQHGVQIRLMPRRIAYMHAKTILTPQAAFLGSQNFSDTSLERNREMGLLLAPGNAGALRSQFEKDWQTAQPMT